MTARRKRSRIGLATALALGAVRAGAVDFDYQFKTTLTGEADAGRDFGLGRAGDQQQAYLDATPWAHLQFSPQWSAFVRARLFAPTGAVLTNGNENNNVGVSSSAFVGLKEAWIDYGGLTSYPGESIRLGRQHVREDDAQWWDQDVDALRWIFDTTLLQYQIGAARESGTYRTDDASLPADQKHRTYYFGTVSTEWRPEQRIGLRVMHADDDGRPPLPGERVEGSTKLQYGHPTWAGVFLDNHYYDGPDSPALAYSASATWLGGHRRTAVTGPAGTPDARTVVATDAGSAHAWAAELDLRYRLPLPRFPLQIGGSYVYSSGGDGSDFGGQFAQTGLETNYSRFTGTRTLVERYTDAYRVELGNVKVASAFVSMNGDRWDGSLVFNHFARVNGGAPVVSDYASVAPNTTGRVLGNGGDLVLTRYFGGRPDRPNYLSEDDPDDSVRLRASVFRPGNAYAGADTEYRITLELTWWF